MPPPSTKQEPNLTQTKSEEERDTKTTQPHHKSQEQQRKEDLEHNRCQDENIKVVVRDNEGKEITVPVTEAHKYQKIMSAVYDVGTCRRDTSAEK